jgi:hypothetical protein
LRGPASGEHFDADMRTAAGQHPAQRVGSRPHTGLGQRHVEGQAQQFTADQVGTLDIMVARHKAVARLQ